MKIAGGLLIIIGIVWGICAFNMDTTVEKGAGYFPGYRLTERVHNLDLADRRRTHLICASVAFVSGIILIGLGSITNLRNASPSTVDEEDRIFKKCPYCAETIKREAKVCKNCGKDLPKQKPRVYTVPCIELVNSTARCPRCFTSRPLTQDEILEKSFNCPKCSNTIQFDKIAG